MSAYTRSSPSSGSGATAAYVDGELAKIETALGAIDDTNRANGSVGNAKLAKPKSDFALQLSHEVQIPVAQTAVVFNSVMVPKDATLVSAKVKCLTKTATATVDLHLKGTGTILSSTITLAADDTVYDGTLSTTLFSEDDIIQAVITTDGTGLIDHLEIVLLFKADHVVA